MKLIRHILFLATAALLLAGCNGNDCPLNNTVRLVCGFYSTTDGSEIAILDTLTISVRDSVILNRTTDSKTVSLPMSYAGDADTLVFLYTPYGSEVSATDTLIVSKTNEPHVVSLECGTSVFHGITAVSHTTRTPDSTFLYAIDSIVVSNSNVNFDGQENLKIYYRLYQ
ncbi:MAG: alpha amylase [Bacteroidaceae bacterium]|nr:alpha amylase [Bacteroidaceae bacterium]